MVWDMLAGLINIGFGVFSLFKPDAVAAASGFKLSKRGTTELRITFGGYFIGMGLAVILLSDPVASRAIGMAWLMAGVLRLVEYIYGKRAAIVDTSFYVFWAFEVIIGVVLIL